MSILDRLFPKNHQNELFSKRGNVSSMTYTEDGIIGVLEHYATFADVELKVLSKISSYGKSMVAFEVRGTSHNIDIFSKVVKSFALRVGEVV